MTAAGCCSTPFTHCTLAWRDWPWPTVCSGIPSPPSLLEWMGCRPGPRIQSPDSWARLATCWQAGGCRPQTRQEMGLQGKIGLWPREGTWCWKKKSGNCLQDSAGASERPSTSIVLSPWLQLFQLQGRQLAFGAAGELLGGYPHLPPFLQLPGEGVGAVPGFLEFPSPRDPTGVWLPRLRGASLHTQCLFPSLSSWSAWGNRGNHC